MTIDWYIFVWFNFVWSIRTNYILLSSHFDSEIFAIMLNHISRWASCFCVHSQRSGPSKEWKTFFYLNRNISRWNCQKQIWTIWMLSIADRSVGVMLPTSYQNHSFDSYLYGIRHVICVVHNFSVHKIVWFE